MQCRRLPILAIGLLHVMNTGTAAAAEGGDPLFRESTMIEATLSVPLNTLVRLRPQDTYVRGEMTFRQPDGSEATFKVKVRTRGNFRHKNCDFPPFLLNFRRKKVKDTLLDEQNKLKLVVHCDGTDRYEQEVGDTGVRRQAQLAELRREPAALGDDGIRVGASHLGLAQGVGRDGGGDRGDTARWPIGLQPGDGRSLGEAIDREPRGALPVGSPPCPATAVSVTSSRRCRSTAPSMR